MIAWWWLPVGIFLGLAVAAVVSGHVDKWLDIRKLEAEKKRSADGGASTDQSNIRKEFFL